MISTKRYVCLQVLDYSDDNGNQGQMSRNSSNYSSSSPFLFLLARLTQSQSQFSNFSHKLKIHLIISRVVTLCTLFTEWEL